MARNGEDRDSVGEATALPFGAVLRRAIKEEFGTGKEFAARLGVNESRVSQLLSGAESLTAQTIDDIVRTFDSLGHQEQLHRAWVSTFAPSPLQSLENREAEASAYRLLEAKERLVCEGRARECLKSVMALRTRIQDADLRRKLLRASVELSLFLGRSEQALWLSLELAENAKQQGEMAWIAQGLWLQATAVRTAPGNSARVMVQAYEGAAQFVAAWNPGSSEGREVAVDMKQALLRDRALTLLALHERKAIPAELSQAIEEIDRHVQNAAVKPETRAVFLEVKGRVYLAQGATIPTEEAIDETLAIRGFVSPDHSIKAAILEGQLLLARGLQAKARSLLLCTLDTCYDLDGLHHARAIEQMLPRIPREDPSNWPRSDARGS